MNDEIHKKMLKKVCFYSLIMRCFCYLCDQKKSSFKRK